MKTCPACGKEGFLRRVPRKGILEKYLLWALFIRPYQCKLCRSRFRFFKAVTDEDSISGARHRPRRSPPIGRQASPADGGEEQQRQFEETLQELGDDERQMDADQAAKIGEG